MDRGTERDLLIAENIVQPLLIMASNCSSIETALEKLIEIARTVEGRSDLASLNIISQLLRLCLSVLYPVGHQVLSLSLKLLRNLCAGEIRNQNAFLEKNGAEVVSTIINSVGPTYDNNVGIVRLALQLLANFVLAGGEHQRAVWCQFFPHGFLNIARVRSRETCDPLCMVIYTCCAGDDALLTALCDEQQGLHVVIEIVRTASMADLAESWFKLLLSRICLEESYIASVFFNLDPGYAADMIPGSEHFVSEQAYILSTLSEILNERIEDLAVTPDFALHILGILKSAAARVDFSTRGKTSLPTGTTLINILGYSLTILRDICACDRRTGLKDDDAVAVLVSSGLIELLLSFLSGLEPPATIQKATKRQVGGTTGQIDCCPYKGYRRDIVAVLGNCAYGRKQVQDEIRKKNGIVLLLQQCVTDEDNPFLREWGIWAARNLLEGNKENQEVVAGLELQRSLDVPELARLGLRVEVDPITHRAKLVNG
ncbi:hypothetical protein DM860_017184 [Cuscuta australis]|uniref:Ataxin-10 domain-containing protein n=1 Tax=Cuscuta australis TaxID=267555 RepID=A0A328DTY9_9ASTE|nr:hypothetical protein DM860_017184 [Cuscuta australis]